MTREREFLWGTASSAFQIEGGWDADGKGESNWDRWNHLPGKIRGGGNADVSIDRYHRWPDDLNYLSGLNINAYRFSIAWSRVMPSGESELNPAGVAFYDDFINALVARGIEPVVTLLHYDIPQALEDEGGWLNRRTGDLFAAYAVEMVRLYGDRVSTWVTFNEPWCIADGHYGQIGEPPGLGDPQAAAQVSHNINVAHGKAVLAMKAVQPHAKISMTWNLYPVHPYHEGLHSHPTASTLEGTLASAVKSEDVEAARLLDGYVNRWWLDPLFKGAYPQDIWEHRPCRPVIEPEDHAFLGIRPDFLGINYYNRFVARAPRSQATDDASTLSERVLKASTTATYEQVDATEYGARVSRMGWEVYPHGLYEILTRLRRDYDNPPIMILENGISRVDTVDADGAVHDQERIDFVEAHLAKLDQAREAGVDVRGYFLWTEMDNFEWEDGWTQQFGLIHVDRDTQVRTIKDSGHWYARELAERRGL